MTEIVVPALGALRIRKVVPRACARSLIPKSPNDASGGRCAISKPQPLSLISSAIVSVLLMSLTVTSEATACLETLVSDSCAMRKINVA